MVSLEGIYTHDTRDEKSFANSKRLRKVEKTSWRIPYGTIYNNNTSM
jgi:hypothetical protein